MTARLAALVVDALDPARLEAFWTDALRGDRSLPIEFRPTTRPKVARNRIHLDLTTESLEDQRWSVEHLLAIGATRVDVGQSPTDPHVVLADPEGNELCLIEPQNGFLAGRGRLGALSCDGSRAVGRFWSTALGWPLIWDEGDETAIAHPGGTGPILSWGGGPTIAKVGPNRWYLAVEGDVEELLALGARRLAEGRLADPDGNEIDVRPG